MREGRSSEEKGFMGYGAWERGGRGHQLGQRQVLSSWLSLLRGARGNKKNARVLLFLERRGLIAAETRKLKLATRALGALRRGVGALKQAPSTRQFYEA